MPLPGSITPRRITFGNYTDMSGDNLKVKVTVQPNINAVTYNPTGDVIVGKAEIIDFVGSSYIDILTNDVTGLSATGWSITVTLEIDGLEPIVRTVSFPSGNMSPVDFDLLAIVSVTPGIPLTSFVQSIDGNSGVITKLPLSATIDSTSSGGRLAMTTAERTKLATIEENATGGPGVTFGTTAGTAAEGNDPRLSDERTPLANSVVNSKVASAAATTLDKTADYTTSLGRLAMTNAERSKLTGIAPGATVNSSDAYLLDRANHTSTQAIGTIAGLQTALDEKIDGADKPLIVLRWNGSSWPATRAIPDAVYAFFPHLTLGTNGPPPSWAVIGDWYGENVA